MNEDRSSECRRQPEHLNHFMSRGAWCVLESDSDPQCACIELSAEQSQDTVQSLYGGGLIGCRTCGWIRTRGFGAHRAGREGHIPGDKASCLVTGTRAKVNEGFPLANIDE